MSKLKVFISHITEEHEVAKSLKSLIDDKFLSVIDVFVSSHEDSISLGDEWLTTIKNSVTNSDLMVVICSPISVARPWINFEAGAGWVRKIPVIPMCHSGIEPGELPVPLNSFHAGKLRNEQDIAKLFKRLAALAKMNVPKFDDTEYFKNIKNYESNITVNALLRDSHFIDNLLKNQISVIEHCIFISTKDWKFFFSDEPRKIELESYDIDFNTIYHLFDRPLILTDTRTRKTFQVLSSYVFKIADNIRFILSNSHLKITPDLKEILNAFLFSLGEVENWSIYLEMLEMTEHETKEDLFKNIQQMIRDKKTPPVKDNQNLILNRIIDYYESLSFYKEWILKYRSTIHALIDHQNN